MPVDVARTTEAVAKLGPGHALAVLALLMVCGAGFLLQEGLSRVHVDLIELRHTLETASDRAREADQRHDRLLIATCFASANGDAEAQRYCEEATR